MSLNIIFKFGIGGPYPNHPCGGGILRKLLVLTLSPPQPCKGGLRLLEPAFGCCLDARWGSSRALLVFSLNTDCDCSQDPVIFSGTVRSNLDPFGQAGSDADIWGALQQAGLADTVQALQVAHILLFPSR